MFTPEVQEIFDNKVMIEKSLNGAKAKLLVNHNPIGKTKPNRFLENQVALMEEKLKILSKVEMELNVRVGKVNVKPSSEGRNLTSSILPSHLKNNDTLKNREPNTKSVDMNAYISQREAQHTGKVITRKNSPHSVPTM